MRFLLFCLLLSAVACDTPEQRWRRLQRDFLKQFPPTPSFLIVAGNDTLALPRPPGQPDLAATPTAADLLLSEANALNAGALTPPEQARVQAFKTMLDSLRRPDHRAFVDPRRYCVNEVLAQWTANAGPPPATLLGLLEKLPDYYTLIQQEWAPVDPRFAAEAIECSVQALDQLEQLAARPGVPPEQVDKARLAIKDFIARCQSAVLE